MSIISNNDIARSIYLGVREKQSGELSLYFKNVVKFLAKKKLLSKASDILILLRKIINKEEGRVLVEVSSPERLDEKTKKHLELSLKKRYEAKEIIFTEILDKNLLGGIKVEVNDEVMDLSMKSKINKLKDYLIRTV